MRRRHAERIEVSMTEGRTWRMCGLFYTAVLTRRSATTVPVRTLANPDDTPLSHALARA
ncbi:hypothetical protein FHX59_005431 [Paraburkholderia silvatlantica]|uniref:Uncharacterized protein n=1 Tax=Paraburkholderia silvatlantica TaxID=321895 RepID=A0ABR6FU45_9BURK|nr:hypothetical protein [Paraburkholderia silvatlantica]PVY26999.1 hypothetical protein C7411_12148 [Paraburkholderia silvatlantica]PXW33275.1 hypothetical protein C7413_12048 [Paraburkholderia silvatlantica]TDQ83662.1 hypothetical protein C7412_12143 [Paraburkholderia silvatlantica]